MEIVYGNARNGKYEIWTSTFSMIECRHVGSEIGKPKPHSDENNDKISAIFRQPFVKTIPLAVDIAEEARRLWRVTEGLKKFQDAVHLASAMRWNVEIMHTYDNDDLLHLSDKLQCRNGALLKIVYPDETTDGPLFGKAKHDG